jgi:hypothetical protein
MSESAADRVRAAVAGILEVLRPVRSNQLIKPVTMVEGAGRPVIRCNTSWAQIVIDLPRRGA